MAKLIDAAEQNQRDGIAKAVAHVVRMHRQGLASSEDVERARMFALNHHFKTMDVETYKIARESGDFDKYEQLMNDPRSGTQAEQEAVMRRAAAHYIADTHLNTQYATAEDQEKYAKIFHEKVSEFIDTNGFGDDADSALVEANIRMNLGEKVDKPKEVPSWSKPVERLSDDDAAVRDFRLRMEGTKGSREYNDTHDVNGTKRNARGEIISEKTLRADADARPVKQKILNDLTKETGHDRGDGFTVDKEYGVRSASEAAEIEAYEQGQRNDAAAAAEASPPPPSDPGPVTLPNPNEA
jgi:hypothetical protein